MASQHNTSRYLLEEGRIDEYKAELQRQREEEPKEAELKNIGQ